ncbi:MAG: ATP phosphoribosyltransferase [Alphaproteobacteria bacterium MarineAlpha2_Bin1]|nr:MAG: ATP phosphoribosyltransferase [Alphaproteobacteria bacterium MarineAlpha2_Bin1]
MEDFEKIILALPKGRILDKAVDLMLKSEVMPEKDFKNPDSRKLRFSTNDKDLDLIRIRSADVPTFVAFGAADIGIAGQDDILEQDYPELYVPLDLKIGICKLVIARSADLSTRNDNLSLSYEKVATKYPNITKSYFEKIGVQADCIKLNGAIELAPSLGLCETIVDIVETGETLKANGLVEKEKITDISTHLIVNRASLKTKPEKINKLINRFAETVHGKAA